jgi:hypothetical protein
VACLSENEVVEFFQSGRAGPIAARIDSHTADCDRCRRLLADFAQMSSASVHARDLPPSSLPAMSSEADAARRSERVELVQRLAQAQARKYIGLVVKG